MNKITALILLISASMLLAAEAGERPVNGVYTGWDPLPEERGPDKSEWFRLHRLTIKGKVRT